MRDRENHSCAGMIVLRELAPFNYKSEKESLGMKRFRAGLYEVLGFCTC